MFKSRKRIHFIGIGGIGMSGLAEYMHLLRHEVSGSDLSANKNVEKLISMGIKTYIGHQTEFVNGADVVIYTSAITKENVEYQEARKQGIAILSRGELLAELVNDKESVVVGGTHGKTTTTSFLASILHETDWDSGYIVGGVIPHLGGHVHLGLGKELVVEADESDGSFLLLQPKYTIVTNIDDDHIEHYGSQQLLHDAFGEFIRKNGTAGEVVLNAHDEKSCSFVKDDQDRVVYFGLSAKKNYAKISYEGRNLVFTENGSEYELFVDHEKVAQIQIHFLGEHNVLNSLAAITVAHKMGVSFDLIMRGLASCRSVDRRLEILRNNDCLEVIDDYAHHPTAIQATLKSIQVARKNMIYVVWEPHRYSRIESCWNELLHSFTCCDRLFVLPIYSASEKNRKNITSDMFVKEINELYPKLAERIEYSQIADLLSSKILSKKITIVTLGAGKIGHRIRSLLQ